MACTKCGSNNVQFFRENTQDETKMRIDQSIFIPSATLRGGSKYKHQTIGVCQDCGNTWKVRSQASKSMLILFKWLMIIAFWPITLSIWFWMTSKVRLDKKIKAILLVGFWVLFFAISMAYSKSHTTTTIAMLTMKEIYASVVI